MAGHVVRTELWSESLKGRNCLEDLDVDRRIIEKRILGKWFYVAEDRD